MRQPEVGDLGVALVVDQHVAGLEVAMQDGHLVCVGDRRGDVGHHAGGDGPVDETTVDDVLERALLHERHDDVGLAEGVDAGLVHGHDPAVRGQPAHGPALAIEASPTCLVEGTEDLHRHGAIEGILAGPVDASGSSGADQRAGADAGYTQVCLVGRAHGRSQRPARRVRTGRPDGIAPDAYRRRATTIAPRPSPWAGAHRPSARGPARSPADRIVDDQ